MVSARRKLLWVGQPAVPANLRKAVADGWEIVPCRQDRDLGPQLRSAPMAVVYPNGAPGGLRWIEGVLAQLDRAPTVAVFLLPPEAAEARALLSRRRGQFLWLPADASVEELAARIAAAGALQPVIGALQAELASARNLGRAGTRQVEELDEEMRLAARLQRDFLPRRLPEVGPVRFGVLYRPIGWVSGDIYDVARLDETHLGFYVADAVGHGLPAALLTMFIKRGLQTKRIVGHAYQIVPPHVALGDLNADICEQNLSSCQFCSAVYCVLDTAGLILTWARAGHPDPLLLHADGRAEVLNVPGSLLGVFPEETYSPGTARLGPGDRLILYSDGAEEALDLPSGSPPERRCAVARAWRSVPRDELLLRLTARLDAKPAGSPTDDDATVIVLDVEA